MKTVRYRDKIQCTAAVYILLDAESPKASIFRTIVGHSHDENNKRLSVTLKTREAIKELYALGVTRPKQILENLEKKNWD